MYYKDACTFTDMNLLTNELCRKTRPTHFRGVCTVVCKLFNIISPDRAYFSQKDAQQLAVIRSMVRDMNFNIEVVACPIIRKKDGLAKSSRNTYLSREEREAALILNKSLKTGKSMIENGEKASEKVINEIKNIIKAEPLAKIDYVKIVDADSILPLDQIKGRVLVAMAVYIGKTRLIDNFIYED